MQINETEISYITKNKYVNNLKEKLFTSIESYTIDQKNNKITSFIVLNHDLELPTNNDIEKYLINRTNYNHMYQRALLANLFKIPLFFISIDENIKKINLYQFKIKKKDGKFYLDFLKPKNIKINNNKLNLEDNSIQKLFEIMNLLRHEKRKNIKPLTHINKNNLTYILNKMGLYLGGNLDGFYIDKKKKNITFVEFSKIGAKVPDINGDKTINYNLSQYMDKDFGRWFALELLIDFTEQKLKETKLKETKLKDWKSRLDIIVWNNNDHYIKKIKNVRFYGKRNKYLKPFFEKEEKYYKYNSKSIKKP